MGWFSKNLKDDEMKVVESLVDSASRSYEKHAAQLKGSSDPVREAGKIGANAFHSMLTAANSRGKRIPMNISRGTMVTIVGDMLDIAQQGGLIAPKTKEEATKMAAVALREMRNTYAWAEANARAARGKRKGAMQGGRPQGQPAPQGVRPQGQPVPQGGQGPMPQRPMPQRPMPQRPMPQQGRASPSLMHMLQQQGRRR